MTDCSDNLYTIKFTDTSKSSLSVAKGQVVTDKADIALVGKTKRDYGEIFNENTLHLLENFACPEVIIGNVPQGIPDAAFTINALLANPIEGQIWYSTTTQRPFKYTVDQGVGEWVQFSTQEDIAGNSGVIYDGEPLPRPVSPITGYEFEYDECTWIVTPFNYTEKINFMICSVGEDGPGIVNMKYRPSGKDLVSGSANYQIIGIRGHTNAGTYAELPPTPTPLVQTVPILSTPTATAITETTATLGGTIVSSGGANITERGIVWGLTANPTIGVDTVEIEGGTATGEFTVNVTGLPDGTPIYYRAYATNSVGTGYTDGNITFTTIDIPEAPTVINPISQDIIGDSASVGATVSDDGGATITARGMRWGISNPPTENDVSVGIGSNGGVNSFVITISPLGIAETIYFQAYAVNSAGEGVSTVASFVSDGTPAIPTVTTNAVLPAIGSTTATVGGEITSNGGRTITRRGVVYGETLGGPYTGDVYDELTTVGTFVQNLTALNVSTTYYFKAYAINSVGTGFGGEESFVTNAADTAPVLTLTPTLSGIKATAATLGGEITDSGGLPIIERGTVWGTTANPTIASAGPSRTTKFPEIPSGTIGEFAKEVTGFSASTTYHFRAYATNGVGTTYSDNRQFTTGVAVVVPTVTGSHSNIEPTTATIGGNITSNGNGTITEYGVRYGRFQNSMTDVENVTGSNITGVFSFDVTGLLANTLYYYQAYAINSAGEGVSTIGNFTTDAVATAPSLTLYAVEVPTITDDGGTLKARMTASGGSPITSYGFYTSTNGGSTWSAPIEVGTSFGSIPAYFYSVQSGFGASQTVHYKAYATNAVGTTETSPLSFATTSGATVPVMSFNAVTAKCATTADISGVYVSSGGASVSEVGVVWGTSSGARTNYIAAVSVPSVGSSFTVSLTGLPGTASVSDEIFFEIYGLNGQGYGYSVEQSFNTATSPTFDGNDQMSFGGTHPNITLGSYISSDNGAPVTNRGFNWGYNSSMSNTVYPPITTGTGLYQATIDTSDGAGETLFARHFATNCAGTTVDGYQTFALGGPADIGYVGSGYYWVGCQLWLKAEVLDYALGIPLIDYGFEWRYYGDVGGYSLEAHSVTYDGRYITGLVLDNASNPPVGGETIEFRAYASNAFQPPFEPITYYDSRTALVPSEPSVASPPILVSWNESTQVAVLRGNIVSLGGASTVTRGVIYGPTYFSLIEGNPEFGDSFEKAVSGTASTTGNFDVTLTSSNMTNVAGSNPVYFRTWVENGCGRVYSTVNSFTVGDAPAVSPTLAVHEVADTWVRVQGSILSDGGLTVTEYGFKYKRSVDGSWSTWQLGTTPPSYAHVVLADPLSGLTPNTPYDIRTYAINSSGTAYSNTYYFTTKTSPVVDSLSIGTPSASDVPVSARIVSFGGSYTYNTDVGFCWNTTGNPDIDNDNVLISPNSGTVVAGGTFSGVLPGLSASQLYYVRAFADGPYGNVGYTSQQSFTSAAPDTTGDVNDGESAMSSKNTLTVCITLAQDGTIRDSNNSQVGTWLLSYPTFRLTEDSSDYGYTVNSVTADVTVGSSTNPSTLSSQINTSPGTLSAGKTFCVVWDRVGDGGGNVYITVTITGPIGTSPGTIDLRIRLMEMIDLGGGE